MKSWTVIYRRELAGLFFSPLAWILICLALFYQAFFFLLGLRTYGGEVNTALSILLGAGIPFWVLMVFLPPLLTMRMVSEESRTGLLEFLLTAPVSDAAVIVGKTFAAATLMALVLATTLVYGAIVHVLGAPPDWGQLLVAWFGAVLVATFFCAIGIVASASSSTPLIAAFFALLLNILFTVAPLAGPTPGSAFHRALGWVIEKVDVIRHFQGSFLTGALDSAHVVFFVAWTAALLFLAVRIVESKRWIG